MTTNTTDRPAAETLIQEATAVMERHRQVSPHGTAYCAQCGSDWPCDAYTQAQAVIALVTELERQRQSAISAYRWRHAEWIDETLATVAAMIEKGADDER